jgi:hypothetical protein
MQALIANTIPQKELLAPETQNANHNKISGIYMD